MTDAPPSTALMAAGSPAAPDPITKISASRSQLQSLLTAVCSIVFHPLEEVLISSESLTTRRVKIQHLQECGLTIQTMTSFLPRRSGLWYRHPAEEDVSFYRMGLADKQDCGNEPS